MSGDLALYRGQAYSADEQVEVIAWAYSHEHANAMAAAVVEQWSINRIVMRPAPVAESTRFADVVRPVQPRIYLEIPIPWEVRAQVDTTPDDQQSRGELGP